MVYGVRFILFFRYGRRQPRFGWIELSDFCTERLPEYGVVFVPSGQEAEEDVSAGSIWVVCRAHPLHDVCYADERDH